MDLPNEPEKIKVMVLQHLLFHRMYERVKKISLWDKLMLRFHFTTPTKLIERNIRREIEREDNEEHAKQK